MYLRYPINLTTTDENFYPLSVRDVHIISYDSTWQSIVHQHSFTELLYCLEGEGHIWTEEGLQPVHPKSMVLINPHVFHTEYSSHDKPLKYVVIGISGVTAFPNNEQIPTVYFYDDMEAKYFPFINAIIEELNHQKIHSREIVHRIVSIIILQLQQETHSLKMHKNTTTDLSSIVYNTKIFIDTHFSGQIDLDTLAEYTHVSKYYLARLFKEEMGKTIIDYLTDVRLQRSQELLESTDYSITQIASIVGFNSSSYFSTKFKELLKISPSDFRKKQKHPISTSILPDDSYIS